MRCSRIAALHFGDTPHPTSLSLGHLLLKEKAIKNAFVPFARDKGEKYLCGTTLVPVFRHSMALYRAHPAQPTWFGVRLGGDMQILSIAASHQTAAL